MSEQTLTHWGKTRDVNYLGSWDIQPGQDLVLTIKKIDQETVVNPINKTKQVKTVMHFAEPNVKPMVLNTTNKKSIATALETPYIENWLGAKISIYALHGTWFGEERDALRIRTKKPDTTEYKCEDCGNIITGLRDKTPSDLVEISMRNCNGKKLCVACQKKFKAEMDKAAVKEEKVEQAPETKPDKANDDDWEA